MLQQVSYTVHKIEYTNKDNQKNRLTSQIKHPIFDALPRTTMPELLSFSIDL